MNVLIVYATSEGQTQKVAERAAAIGRERGHQVALRDSAAPGSGTDLESFDAFIAAASVHQKQHQESITDFVIAHRGLLDAKPSSFISVSLSAALEEGQAEAQSYVDCFMGVTGWRPPMTLLLGGALRFTDYDYFQEQIVKFIVMQGGGPVSAEHDREFTDWDALARFVEDFLDAAAGRSGRP